MKDKLFIAGLITWMIDTFLTIANQSPAYWSTGFRSIREANPYAYSALCYGPAGLLAFDLLQLTILWILIKYLPASISYIINYWVLFGEIFAVLCWIGYITGLFKGF